MKQSIGRFEVKTGNQLFDRAVMISSGVETGYFHLDEHDAEGLVDGGYYLFEFHPEDQFCRVAPGYKETL